MASTAKQAWQDEAARMRAERDDFRSRAKQFRKEATAECRRRDPLRWIKSRENARLFDTWAKDRDAALKVAVANAKVSA